MGMTESLIEQYGELTSDFERQYLRNLVSRLLAEDGNPDKFHLILLNAPTPWANTTGRETIVITRPLVLRLRNEGELAFILGHELSHILLDHAQSSDDRADLELAADAHALGLIARAGYDPRVALGALTSNAFIDLQTEGYPSGSQRAVALQHKIMESGWEPPGTIDRRDFRKLKDSLR